MQQDPPIATSTDNPPGFRAAFWVAVALFIVLSAIGAVILITNTPSCDVAATVRTSDDCTVRDQYIFFTGGAIAAATLFALVLCALGMALNALARIEERL